MAKARILVSTHILGVAVPAGACVDVPPTLLPDLVALGEADDHPDAVAYAESIAEPIVISAEPPANNPPSNGDASGAAKALDLDALTAELDKLKKSELVEYADTTYALELDPAMNKADMIAAIIDSAKIATK